MTVDALLLWIEMRPPMPERDESKPVRLRHPDGTEVHILLPADPETVGNTMIALGELGYRLPDGEGARSVTMTFDVALPGGQNDA